jgi:hypothetical protein
MKDAETWFDKLQEKVKENKLNLDQKLLSIHQLLELY